MNGFLYFEPTFYSRKNSTEKYSLRKFGEIITVIGKEREQNITDKFNVKFKEKLHKTKPKISKRFNKEKNLKMSITTLLFNRKFFSIYRLIFLSKDSDLTSIELIHRCTLGRGMCKGVLNRKPQDLFLKKLSIKM